MTTLSARFSIHPNDLPGRVKAAFAEAVDRIEQTCGEERYIPDWTSVQFNSDEVLIENRTLSSADWKHTSWTDVDVTVRAVKNV